MRDQHPEQPECEEPLGKRHVEHHGAEEEVGLAAVQAQAATRTRGPQAEPPHGHRSGAAVRTSPAERPGEHRKDADHRSAREPVALAMHRDDELGMGGHALELLAPRPHVHVHGAALGEGVVPPDLVE